VPPGRQIIGFALAQEDVDAEEVEDEEEAKAELEAEEEREGGEGAAEAEAEPPPPSPEGADAAADEGMGGAGAVSVEPVCHDIDDHRGSWTGSTKVGMTYMLTCAPGFAVIGTRGNGTRGRSTASMTCPQNLEWPKDLWCEDIDDCVQLKHGCGATGICEDKVGGYDCNCEWGYPRNHFDGEIVCGDRKTDLQMCGGHTCGAYGICISLRGNLSAFEDSPDANNTEEDAVEVKYMGNHNGRHHNYQTYRCECVEGYFDNGTTCVPRDCGRLRDALGIWIGSTHTGEEYTLKCPPGSSVWGGALREFTISCGNKGSWLSKPTCVNPYSFFLHERLERLEYFANIAMVVFCICSAAVAAGLTLGMVSLDPFQLRVILATHTRDCGSSEERRQVRRDQACAKKMLPLLQDRHKLLVTLLLFNTVANEALPIFLDELVPPWAALLLSVSAVLICGEILPSAVFTGSYQFAIAGAFVPFVGCLQVVLQPVVQPIAQLLDRLLPEDDDDGMKYSRAELRALLQLHGRAHPSENDELDSDHPEDPRLDVSGPSGPSRADDLAELPDASSPVALLRLISRDSLGSESEVETVLSPLEVNLINNIFGLKEKKVWELPYLRLDSCLLASSVDTAAEVLANGSVEQGHRAVLVVDSVDARDLCPLRAGHVHGCLQLSDLLRGGSGALSELHPEPPVLLGTDCSLLRALGLLAEARASIGVVYDSQEAANAAAWAEDQAVAPAAAADAAEDQAAAAERAAADTARVLGAVTTAELLAWQWDDGQEETQGHPALWPSDVQSDIESGARVPLLQNRRRMLAGSKVLMTRTTSRDGSFSKELHSTPSMSPAVTRGRSVTTGFTPEEPSLTRDGMADRRLNGFGMPLFEPAMPAVPRRHSSDSVVWPRRDAEGYSRMDALA